jgi:uncharacterized protein VirK/YbjX
MKEQDNIHVLEALAIVYHEELAQPRRTFYYPILRSLAAARIIFFPNAIAQFCSMKLIGKLRHPTRKHDPLYFLAHNYYISRKFTLRQRVEVAINHHKYELHEYGCDYARQVYRSEGVLLWERSFDNLHFNIVLTATPDNRHEGDLTVILSVNDQISNFSLCRMSFCYLNASIFGLPSDMTMLISRNQTDRTSFRSLFDRYFKQNTPQLFCLAAVCGIAIANGFKTVFAIKHDAQVNYEELLHSSFHNSYTALWERFGAIEIDQHVYKLNVPLRLRPVRLVSRVHRRRARARRGYWDEIVRSARENMVRYRTLSSSDPTFDAASREGAALSGGQFSSETTLWASATATSGPDDKPGEMLSTS